MKYKSILYSKVIQNYWHGTSLVNLRTILKKGLVADTNERKNVHTNYTGNVGNLISVHGIYLTKDLNNAKNYASMGHRGQVLIYCQTSIDNETFALDEDRFDNLYDYGNKFNSNKRTEKIVEELRKIKQSDILKFSDEIEKYIPEIKNIANQFIEYLMPFCKTRYIDRLRKELEDNIQLLIDYISIKIENSFNSILMINKSSLEYLKMDSKTINKVLLHKKWCIKTFQESRKKLTKIIGKYLLSMPFDDNELTKTLARTKGIGFKGATRILSIWAEYYNHPMYGPCFIQVYGDTKFNKLLCPNNDIDKNHISSQFLYYVNPYFHGYSDFLKCKKLIDANDDGYSNYIETHKPYF